MPAVTPEHSESNAVIPAESGLAGRVLLGWMDREPAIRFLMEDCLFPESFTVDDAEELWLTRQVIAEKLRNEPEPSQPRNLALSEADLKAVRKFRNRHPEAGSILDFVKLNPMDLVVRQPWISTAIAEAYQDRVTPDKWLQTALLDPPANPRTRWGHDGTTVFFDLPHGEYSLSEPGLDGHLEVSEADGYVTVALHAGRALLLRGYHRVFACAQGILEAPNAPRGLLFGVSDAQAALGNSAPEALRIMEGPRPPRMADFFNEQLFFPVTLRRRQYRMRIRCEVSEIPWEETEDITESDRPAPEQPRTGRREYFTAQVPERANQGNAQRLHSEGVRLLQAGKIAEARAQFERVLFLRPDHADAHSNLGLTLAEEGRIAEAEQHYRLALTLQPKHAAAHNNLASLLVKQGRLDESSAQYQEALASDPGLVEAHTGFGNVLKNQGQFDQAMAHFGRATDLRPAHAEAWFHRAEIKTFQKDDPELAALEALAGRKDLSQDNRIFAQFALAKALADCGDYKRSFEILNEANELKREQIQYDEPTFVKLFEQIENDFDRALLERLAGSGDPSAVPIFVLGMPRSGSSLIEQILASHPQIHGGGELAAMDAAERDTFGAAGVLFPDFVPFLDSDSLKKLGAAYLAHLPVLGEGQSRIVDKVPGNFLKIGLIRMMLPNAKIIHTMRDPVDTCVSCYSKLFNGGHDFAYRLTELGRHYKRYAKLMAHWRTVLPADAMIEVAYEDVVDDLEGQARRLIEYCGLPWDERCVEFYKNTRPVQTASSVQVRQPLFRSSLQRWRKYEAYLGPLLRELDDLATGERPAA